MSIQSIASRGSLIIFEGCDRSGKTTVCQRMVKYLNEQVSSNGCDQPPATVLPRAKMMRFPDRTTQVGTSIDSYLKGKARLDDHVVHLLFSANRWEMVDELKKSLEMGQHVLVDRYAASGVAFTAAKDGMSFEWCKGPDQLDVGVKASNHSGERKSRPNQS